MPASRITPRNRLWLRSEVRAFVNRKPVRFELKAA